MQLRNAQRIRILLVLLSLVLLAVLLPTANTQEKPVYKPTGSEATIVGTISFAGTAPKQLIIDTSADPICEMVSPVKTDLVLVTDQKLANVVVYVRGESLNAYSFDAPSPDVTLEHKGCQYVPHVLAMQTQQTLKIFNSDSTIHNTHPTPKINREWNQSQAPGAPALEQRFTWPELFIPIRDNTHPWEKAYVGVFSHPFFSISGTDGSYQISGVPSGKYTVVAWHEKLGEQTAEVLLGDSEQKTVDFAFKPSFVTTPINKESKMRTSDGRIHTTRRK